MNRSYSHIFAIVLFVVLLTAGNGRASESPSATQPAGEQQTVTARIDKTTLNNGGTVVITGKAPAGKPVYLEMWSERMVRTSRFDSEVDKETGKIPYILYMTHEMPAWYRIYVPVEKAETLKKIEAQGKSWSYSRALKELGADVAYSKPGKLNIDRHQATLMGSIIGSRGELLRAMEMQENHRRSMQLVKTRFRVPKKVFAATVRSEPDGSFSATTLIDAGSAPGKYHVRALVDEHATSETLTVENTIAFPYLYLSNAGTSLNLFGPFLLSLAVSIFGVLMGAGGGFILNPLLLALYPLPHTVVAGTVMPTVAFSQASGIYNYSKIRFINWKLGITIGISMLLGGYIGPKLTEMVSLEQYKFIFGWILLILAGLMVRQTLPGYIAGNKKEQAIMKQFCKLAEEAAQSKKPRCVDLQDEKEIRP